MKVLFTHELFSPYIVGGGEIYCELLVRGLLKKGIDVTVVAGSWEKSKFEIWEGIPIHRVNLFPSRYLFNIKNLIKLKEVSKKIKPDLIHANTYHSAMPASIIGKIHKKPVVLSTHSFFLTDWFQCFNPIYAAAFYTFERLMYKFPFDNIICLDWGIYDKLCALGMEDKLSLVPHPVDVSKFKPNRKKNDKITIGSVSRFYDVTKKLDSFFEAIEKFSGRKNVDFLAVGPYTKKQEEFFRKNNIKFTGKVPYSEIPKYLNEIDIFIGQGMAAKEAMSTGCATVLNKAIPRFTGYHRTEIKEGAMLSGNTLDIVEDLLNNPEKINKLSKKSVNFIRENYSLEKIVERVIEVYEKILN